jgi:hypothetical protein
VRRWRPRRPRALGKSIISLSLDARSRKLRDTESFGLSRSASVKSRIARFVVPLEIDACIGHVREKGEPRTGGRLQSADVVIGAQRYVNSVAPRRGSFSYRCGYFARSSASVSGRFV